MLRMLHSLVFWGFILISSLALFPVALVIWAVTSPFDRRKVLLHRFTCFWASLYTWTNPAWPVRLEHREKLYTEGPCVMVANHLSLLDILVLFRLFSHFKWVSKVENFRVPFIGWNMHLNGYIVLRRGEKASVVQMMRACELTLAAGNSIMMFPEGTRSPHGRMRTFKTGAFELAKRAGTPIQPLVIRGTANALPKQGFVLQGRHPISITVLDALPPESFADSPVEELTQRVRELIAAEIEGSSTEPEAAGTVALGERLDGRVGEA
jgi:1-acyl-sn-glycerol-3-phosphate acyltransferase